MKPEFWKCGGGFLPYKYGFGYWTGEQEDLLCVKPNIKTNEEAERLLSPICKSKISAIFMFLIKILRRKNKVKLDELDPLYDDIVLIENREIKTSTKKVKGGDEEVENNKTVLNFSISKQVMLTHTGEEVYKFLKSKFLEDYKKRKKELKNKNEKRINRIGRNYLIK